MNIENQTMQSGIDACTVDALLQRTFWIKRSNVMAAFGLSGEEMTILVNGGVFRAEYPFGPGTRARFVRSQVLDVARKWTDAQRNLTEETPKQHE